MAITRVSQSTVKEGLERANNFLAGFAPLGMEYDSIATVTVGAGGASSIDFSSIPQTYQHLQIRLLGRSSLAGVDDVTGLIRFNADSGANYSRHRLYGYGVSAGADAAVSSTAGVLSSVLANNNTATCFSGCVCDILDYTSTSKNKVVRSFSGGDANDRGSAYLTSTLWMSTASVTSIQLSISSGNWVQYSTAALYGLKAPAV